MWNPPLGRSPSWGRSHANHALGAAVASAEREGVIGGTAYVRTMSMTVILWNWGSSTRIQESLSMKTTALYPRRSVCAIAGSLQYEVRRMPSVVAVLAGVKRVERECEGWVGECRAARPCRHRRTVVHHHQRRGAREVWRGKLARHQALSAGGEAPHT
eukprot:scaffold197937_cov37-Tisochrysis_lutea.AAC.3